MGATEDISKVNKKGTTPNCGAWRKFSQQWTWLKSECDQSKKQEKHFDRLEEHRPSSNGRLVLHLCMFSSA